MNTMLRWSPTRQFHFHQVADSPFERFVGGAMVGGWLGRVLGFYRPGEAAGFVMAIVGAIVILALYRLVSGRSRV